MAPYSNDEPCCLLPSSKKLEPFTDRFPGNVQKPHLLKINSSESQIKILFKKFRPSHFFDLRLNPKCKKKLTSGVNISWLTTDHGLTRAMTIKYSFSWIVGRNACLLFYTWEFGSLLFLVQSHLKKGIEQNKSHNVELLKLVDSPH